MKTASISLSSTETGISVIYYSQRSLVPALMAAIRHCRPDISFTDCIVYARHHLSGKSSGRDAVYLTLLGNGAGGETVYAATTADAPSILVERTLVDFLEIAGGGRVRCIVGTGLPRVCRCIFGPCRHKNAVQWREIATQVEQLKLRLQAESYRHPL